MKKTINMNELFSSSHNINDVLDKLNQIARVQEYYRIRRSTMFRIVTTCLCTSFISFMTFIAYRGGNTKTMYLDIGLVLFQIPFLIWDIRDFVRNEKNKPDEIVMMGGEVQDYDDQDNK